MKGVTEKVPQWLVFVCLAFETVTLMDNSSVCILYTVLLWEGDKVTNFKKDTCLFNVRGQFY